MIWQKSLKVEEADALEKIELRHILDFAVVFGLAKLSRGIAVLILKSIPAHAAVLAKAALAYALTWAIGEAIVWADGGPSINEKEGISHGNLTFWLHTHYSFDAKRLG